MYYVYRERYCDYKITDDDFGLEHDHLMEKYDVKTKQEAKKLIKELKKKKDK